MSDPETAFATIISFSDDTVSDCSIAPTTGVPADFRYQTTDPATNLVTGTPDTPIDIPALGQQSFVIAVTPTAVFAPVDVEFDCDNTSPGPVNVGVNTLLLSASDSPVPDIVALAATLTDDGIVRFTSRGNFAVATVNVGVAGTVSADTQNQATRRSPSQHKNPRINST